MSKIYQSYLYFMKMKNNELNFLTFINKGLKNIDANQRAFYRDVIKALVNRYYFLKWEEEKLNLNLDVAEYFIVVLAVYHYAKNYPQENILHDLNDDKDLFTTPLDTEKIYQVLLSLNHDWVKLSDEENKNFISHVAIHFAYPRWVVKMMVKHFGHKITFHALSSSRKNINLTVKVKNNIDVDSIINQYPSDFKISKLNNNGLVYLGKDIVNHPLFLNKTIEVEDEISLMLINKLDPQPFENILLMYPKRDSIIHDVVTRSLNKGQIYCLMNNISEMSILKRGLERKNINNVEVINDSLNLLITYIPNNSVDKILITPPSSNLGLVRRNPQELITLDANKLDSLIENQKLILEEATKFISKNGIIIYACYTYNKKETIYIIKDFLNKHNEYQIAEEKMIFANEIPSDGIYYAVITRGDSDD